MEHTIESLEAYFQEEIRACQQCIQALSRDDREDEAKFQRIRSNIFDIFRTVLTAARRQHGDNVPAVRNFFLLRLEQIPTAWESSRRTAALHGDSEKMQIETIKLDAVAEIRQTAVSLWEGAQ